MTTVSIGIPTYNGQNYIRETIGSVLSQTFSDFEVLVSDDGSTDATLDVVRSMRDPRIRIVGDGSRVGPAGNWNRALSSARSPYLKLLPQDDLLHGGILEAQLRILEANLALSFVAVRRNVVGADGAVLVRDRGLSGLCGEVDLVTGSRRTVRSGGNPFGEGGGILFRRDAANAIGPFDGSLGYVLDVDYWLRLLEWGPAYGLCETYASFRVSGSAWSNMLAREQGRQYGAFIDRVAADQHRNVTSIDVRAGKVKARANGMLRRAFYLRHRARL